MIDYAKLSRPWEPGEFEEFLAGIRKARERREAADAANPVPRSVREIARRIEERKSDDVSPKYTDKWGE